MIKEKECKGHGKAFGANACGKMTEVSKRKYGLCPSCYWNWMQTSEAGKIHYQKQFLPMAKKQTEKRAKEEKQRLTDELTNWRDKLQSKVQEISRLIDVGLPCLALGYHAGQIHGGHIFSKGSNKTIALNLHNIHRQSAQSNHSHNDDGLLREKLAKEYGKDYFEFISELRRCPALHYTNLEYKKFYKKACTIALNLKKAGQNFNKEQRILIRNRLNRELSIYDKEYCDFELKK